MLSKVIAFLKDSDAENLDEDLLNDCLGLYVAVSDLKKLVRCFSVSLSYVVCFLCL